MQTKKILTILLAACSCLPSVAASERSEKKDANNSAKSINPTLAGMGGFVVGSALGSLSAGLGVRHYKNKEIDEEKGKITTLDAEKQALKTENDALKTENDDLKKKIKVLWSVMIDGMTPDHTPTETEVLDLATDSFKNMLSLKKCYNKIMNTLKKGGCNYFSNDIVLGGGGPEPQIDILKYMRAYDNNLTENGQKCAHYLFRSLLSLAECTFDTIAHPSAENLDNYDQNHALDAELPLKPLHLN